MGTLETAIGWIGVAIEPLGALTNDAEIIAFVAELGWTLIEVPQTLRDLIGSTGGVRGSLARVIDSRASVAAGESSNSDADEQTLAADLAALVTSLANLGPGLRAQLPAPYVAATGIDLALVERIYDSLVERFLRLHFGAAHALLFALGVIEVSDESPEPASYQPAYTSIAFRWDRLSTAVTDPGRLLLDVYGYGTPQIDAVRLFDALVRLSYFVGLPAEIHYPSPTSITALDPATGPVAITDLEAELWLPIFFDGNNGLFAVITPLPRDSGPQRLAVTLALRGTVSATVPLSSTVTLVIEGAAQLAGGAAAVFSPGKTPRTVIGGAPDTETGSLGASLHFARLPGPTRLLTVSESATLDVDEIEVALGAVRSSGSAPEATFELALKNLHVRVGASDSGGDGLLTVLIPQALDAKIDARLVWSTATGVHFSGSGGLALSLPTTAEFGLVRVTAVGIGINASPTGINVSATVAGNAALGPVTLGFDGIGLGAALGFGGGNLGALDLDIGFQPPKTISLGIAASPLSGGGAISVDASHGRYAGLLLLDYSGVKLTAYGLLDTRPPGGGYSLAAVISAQFRPIQLILGFTLNGVGGLIAINRRVDGDALRTALHGAGIGDIFFASDPIAQAGRLLGDLSTYFPPAMGRYAFGPAFKIGWGTPTIVEAEIAVLLELPAPVRLFLLGSVYTILPTKDHPLIRLQVDVVGEYDISEKRLAIDATLRDSRVLAFPIVGDFALRASWGSQKCLVISVGGFHSQFRPPPDFPTLRRVRIPIGADKDPRLEITGFLAVTSNTAQIGASVDLYASAGPLNIHGNVGFEALFQFSPFAFTAELSAGVELRRGTTTLASVHLDGTLTGTTPWHVSGEACLSCWLFDLCVPFSAPFGSDAPVVLPPTAIWPAVQPVLQDRASWAADLPDGAARAVTTAPPVDATAAAASTAHVEPSAALTVRQKIVPLDRTVTRFAQGAPTDVTQLTVTRATIGSGAVSYTPVTDWFAPAQFEDLSDADRLSRDGFELMDAGVSLASDAVLAGSELVNPLAYETVTIPPPPTPPERYHPSLDAQLLASQLGTFEVAPKLVTAGGLPEDSFVIASADDLTLRGDIIGAGARGLAELALAAHLAAHPEDTGHVIVVPVHELAA